MKNETLAQKNAQVSMKNEGKKIQNENIKQLNKINYVLKHLIQSSKELEENFGQSSKLLTNDLKYKIQSGLE